MIPFDKWLQREHALSEGQADLFIRLLHEYGAMVCREYDHDYAFRVVGTRNMRVCFRCGEPGWEMPTEEEQ